MDFIHKFSVGPVEMDKMLEEYHQLRKTRRYCAACPNYNKYWSCPEYAFDEVLFLEKFKYMYLIAREYEIPREDRQKVIGIQAVSEYCKQMMQTLKVQSWKDLLELEGEVPGTLSLMPGNCHICDISGEGCARPSNQKCRHPELMRFSLESLGFDVDAICKYEIGVLLLWPKEGHLPEKLCGIMGIMSNEKIPMDVIKAHFPDAQKSWLRFSQTAPESRNEVRQSVKRQQSWIDNQAKEHREMIQDPSYRVPSSWIGYKSDALNSGDYVKNRPWMEEEKTEVETVVEETETQTLEAQEEKISVLEEEPQLTVSSDVSEDDEENKFKWLGFKRSVEEAEEELKKRPIPKFNVLEEEETSEDFEVKEEVEDTEEKSAEVVEVISVVEPEDPEITVLAEEEKEAEPPVTAEPEAEEEVVELLDASSVASVLSAAIEIARDVVGDDFIKDESVFAAEEPDHATQAEDTAGNEEDDSKYKWLGFKASNLEEEEGPQKGGWKKNY
ncbi:MAG: DUF2284 domain-containing protein [Eubacterium sp.]